VVECNLAKVEVAGSNPVSRSIHGQLYAGIENSRLSARIRKRGVSSILLRRRSQVAKAEVCKTFIRRFESARRLQRFLSFLTAP
jgi:uncharacterized membrane protein YcjF (UPF0283 family)